MKKLEAVELALEELKKTEIEKATIGLQLFEKAVFLEKTLKKLQKEVDKTGVVTEMCQGSYSINRENPALKSYNSTMKIYQSVMRQIVDLLPAQKQKTIDDSFEEF